MSTRRALREARTRRSRKARALLAAGLVLGVGAGVTLATWNDAEHAGGTFTASVFGIVGATNGSTFAEHASAGSAATLGFQLPAEAAAMSPGRTVYALYSVKTIANSVGGTVQLKANAANDSGLGAHLTYSVRTIAGTTCNATSFAAGTSTGGLPQAQPLTAGASGTQALAANGGAQVNYCFQVTLPSGTPNSAQGGTLTANWTFEALST